MEIITKEELSELILANQRGMYLLAYSILRNNADAQDAVSECIVRAFEHRKKLRKKDSARSWLMKILMNVSRSVIVKEKKILLTAEPEQYNDATSWKEDEMWPLIMELQEELRIVIVLHYYENMSVKEIGSMLKIPEGTVKTRLSRGRKKLAQIIEQ